MKRSVIRRAGWLVVPLLAVVVWLLVRGGGQAKPAESSVTSPGTATAATEASSGRSSRGELVTAGKPSSSPVTPDTAPVGGSAAVRPDPARTTEASAPKQNSPRPPTPGPAPTGSGSAGSGESRSGGLTDKTGWADTSVAKQLNRELTPLMSECIDQAKARHPKLHGMLALSMSVAPTDNGKVIVSVTPASSNQIEDAELLECIRESSFSIEGLKAPHDFQISMPLD